MKEKIDYRIKEIEGQFIIEVYDYWLKTIKDGLFKSHKKRVYKWFTCCNDGEKRYRLSLRGRSYYLNSFLDGYKDKEDAIRQIRKFTQSEESKPKYYDSYGEQIEVIPNVSKDERSNLYRE